MKSAEVDTYAHIPKERLIDALKELEIEINPEEVEDFFARHDDNGDGFFDFDEFKQAMRSPHAVPKNMDIRKAFEDHSVKQTGHFDDNLPESYIPSAMVGPALEALSLKQKMREKAQAYFAEGALKDGLISFEEFNQALLSISPLPDEQDVDMVYRKHAEPGRFLYIPTEKLSDALLDLGLEVTRAQLDHFRSTVKLNFNDCIKYNAFKHIVRSPSATEVWAKTLPLARLLAEALPKHSGCDHLRVLSSLTPNEADNVAEEVCRSLKELLKQHVTRLKASFMAMDKQVAIQILAGLFSMPLALPHPLIPRSMPAVAASPLPPGLCSKPPSIPKPPPVSRLTY